MIIITCIHTGLIWYIISIVKKAIFMPLLASDIRLVETLRHFWG